MKKYFKINPYFFSVAAITYLIGFSEEYILMFLILALHEISHLIAICFERIEISYIKLEPFGLTVRLKERIFENPKKEIVMAAAGPLANFLFAYTGYIINFEAFSFFVYANLSMGIFNLLPAYPLDGGRILKAYLSIKYGYIKSYKLVLGITKITAIIFILAGAYILYATRFNFFICITGCFLYFNLLTEKNYSYFYLVKEISEYKKKNRHIEKMPVITVAVNKEFNLRKILNDLSFMRYYMFEVIDNGKRIATLTEGELIEGLIKKGAKAKIKDIISLKF